MLRIENLRVSSENKEILKGLSLQIPKGEIHVMMGPNGVGKSSLAYALMGAKHLQVSQGEFYLDGVHLNPLSMTARSLEGLFLAFQYPIAISGLKISEYLRSLYQIHSKKTVSVSEFRRILKDKLDLLEIDRTHLSRYLNEGFSGGEMKRFEMLQLMLLCPKVAVLDEIDSGVDVDAQKIMARAITHMSQEHQTTFLLITHYNRLAGLLEPHKIHIVLDGKIERSGGMDLVKDLEQQGYDWMRKPV